MMLRYAPHSAALRQAIILLDRPVVGRDGHRGGERLPHVVRVRATVVGASPVTCSIDAAAIARALGVDAPTWTDLQVAWQTLATRIQAKIRAGDIAAGPHGHSTVHVAAADVPDATGRRPAPRG